MLDSVRYVGSGKSTLCSQDDIVTKRPDLIDNQGSNTLAHALREFFGEVGSEGITGQPNPPDAVRIATAFFNPTGFAQIADPLGSVPMVRLLLGADPSVRIPDQRRQLDESPEEFEQRQLREGFQRL